MILLEENEINGMNDINEDIKKVKIKKKYDYVIIENVLANLNNPEKILAKADSFLKEKGHLILSTSDNFSFFADKLRGLLSKKSNRER